MSARDEMRRPLYRPPPPPPINPNPVPYTTLNQPASDRLRLTPPNVKYDPLSPQSTSQESKYTAQLAAEGLSSVASQINSSENQARLSQNAYEIAQAARTSAQLQKNLEQWRFQETQNIDKQIEETLAKQGITKEMIQRNTALRREIARWKSKIYSTLNTNLDKNEQEIVVETGKSLASTQLASRQMLSENIEKYEAGILPAITRMVENTRQQKFIDSLIADGLITQSGDMLQLTKSPKDLTAEEKAQAEKLGFNLSNIPTATAAAVKTSAETIQSQEQAPAVNEYMAGILSHQQEIVSNLTGRGVISQQGDSYTISKPLNELSQQDLSDLTNIGFKDIISTAHNYTQKYNTTTTLKSDGIIAEQDGNLMITKPLHELSNAQLDQLRSLGFTINLGDIYASKSNATYQNMISKIQPLSYAGVVKVVDGSITLLKPLSELSADQIKTLNELGFNINQGHVIQSALTSSLINRGVIAQENDAYTVAKPLETLSDYDISQLKSLGFAVTTQQRDDAVAYNQLQNNVRDLKAAGLVTVEGDTVSVARDLHALTPLDIDKLRQIGFVITQGQVDEAQRYKQIQDDTDALLASGTIARAVENDQNINLVKSYADLTPEEIQKLNNMGFSITPEVVSAAKNMTPTQHWSVEDIAAQNQVFEDAYKSGKITAEQYNVAVQQQNANLAAINSLSSQLVSSGLINKVGDSYTLTKPLANYSSAQLDQLNKLGFGITYDQVLASKEQQNALFSLNKAGVVSTTHTPSAPLSKTLQLDKPLVSVSDAQIQQLKQVGFTITPAMEAQRIETQNLIRDGVVKLSNDQLTISKPLTALSDYDISRLKDIGFTDVPVLPKGPEQMLYESVSDGKQFAGLTGLTKDGAPMLGGSPLVKSSAIVGDVITGLAAPVQLVGALVSGDPTWGQFRGPTSENIKYYDGSITDLQQAGVAAGGLLASSLATFGVTKLASIPIGFASKAIQPVAKGLTTQLLRTTTGTDFVLSMRDVAKTLKIPLTKLGLAKIPSTEVSSAQLTKAMATILKNPKMQQAIVWGSMTGMSAVDVYGQVASGKPINEILANMAPKIGSQIGAIAGFTSGYKLGQEIANERLDTMAKLVRLTGGEIKVTSKGTFETSFKQMKDVPKQLKQLYELELDAATGKVNVIGFITKIDGKKTIQPIVRQFAADDFNTLMQSGKLKYSQEQLQKLSLKQLFDKVVLNKNLTPNEVKTVLVKYIGEDGYKELNMLALKSGAKQMIEMSPKQMKAALYKELGEGSLWTKPLSEIEKLSSFPLINKTQVSYIGAGSDASKLRVPPEVQVLMKQLKGMGLDDTEAAYWTSQIMTKQPEKILGKLENVMDNALDKAKVAELVQYGKNSTSIQMLKSAGLSDKQVENVLKASALSKGNQTLFLKELSAIDSKSASVTLQLLQKDEFASALLKMDTKPLAKIVESAASSGNAVLAAGMLGVLSAKSASQVFSTLSPSAAASVTKEMVAVQVSPVQMNSIISQLTPTQLDKVVSQLTPVELTALTQNLSPEAVTKINSIASPQQLSGVSSALSTEQIVQILPTATPVQVNSILSSLSADQLNKVIPSLKPDQLSRLIPNISSDQLNEVLPKLKPEQFNEILPKLKPEQLNEVLLKLSPEQLNEVLPKLSTGEISTVMQSLKITPELMLQYLQIPAPTIPGIKPITITPLMRVAIEKKLRANRKETTQSPRMFDVSLQFSSSAEQFKIRSNSFHGAAREALVRKVTKSTPLNIVVSVLQERQTLNA